GERVHLLLDDVGDLADASREQLGALENGQAGLGVTVGLAEPTRRGPDALPGGCRGGQDVLDAANGLDRHRPCLGWFIRPRSAFEGSLYRGCRGRRGEAARRRRHRSDGRAFTPVWSSRWTSRRWFR